MKMNNLLMLLFLFLMSAFIFSPVSSGQCDSDIFLDKCASNLGTYNYIKSFTVNASPKKKANREYSYVFSKGSTYMLIVCDYNVAGGKMTVNLYDRDHNLIASSYDEETKKHYSELCYPCSATGVYYIKTTFQGAKKGCGICILGFNKE